MNKNLLIVLGVIAVIIIGALYYYGGYNYNYGTPTPTANTSETPNPQGAYPISIKNFVFDPAILNISAGSTVIWTNNDSVAHRISGNGFQSSDLANGQSYSFTFTSSGTFDYICSIHPSMKGKIIVK